MYTSGNVSEALSWLTELDKEYKLTTADYGMADFIQDLIDKGYIQQEGPQNPGFVPSVKMEKALRQKALDDIKVAAAEADRKKEQRKAAKSTAADQSASTAASVASGSTAAPMGVTNIATTSTLAAMKSDIAGDSKSGSSDDSSNDNVPLEALAASLAASLGTATVGPVGNPPRKSQQQRQKTFVGHYHQHQLIHE